MVLCIQAITAWELAARLIQRRELLLSQLEDFEREASDPSRFFQQGIKGFKIIHAFVTVLNVYTSLHSFIYQKRNDKYRIIVNYF